MPSVQASRDEAHLHRNHASDPVPEVAASPEEQPQEQAAPETTEAQPETAAVEPEEKPEGDEAPATEEAGGKGPTEEPAE